MGSIQEEDEMSIRSPGHWSPSSKYLQSWGARSVEGEKKKERQRWDGRGCRRWNLWNTIIMSQVYSSNARWQAVPTEQHWEILKILNVQKYLPTASYSNGWLWIKTSRIMMVSQALDIPWSYLGLCVSSYPFSKHLPPNIGRLNAKKWGGPYKTRSATSFLN